MLKVGDVLDLGPLGMKFYIKKTAAETNGQSFEMDMELVPQTDAGIIHIHPHAIESYEVLQGKFDVYVNGKWRTLSVGEKAVVDKGVPHTFRNASSETTAVREWKVFMVPSRAFLAPGPRGSKTRTASRQPGLNTEAGAVLCRV